MKQTLKFFVLFFIISVILYGTAHAAPAEEKPSAKVTVNLYSMSHCPYSVDTESTLISVVRSLEGFAGLNIHFISSGTVNNKGEVTAFRSLHGPAEAEENFRRVCIRNDYPDKFLDYIWERNKDYRSPDWQTVARKVGIPLKSIESCLTSHEGVRLFFEDTKAHILRRAYKAPTIDINGVVYKGNRDTRSLTAAICDAFPQRTNPLPSVCSKLVTLPGKPVDIHTCMENVPTQPPFDIHIVKDDACAVCTETLQDSLKKQHPNAHIHFVDRNSNLGQSIIQTHNATILPFYLLDKEVEADPNFSALIKSAYKKSVEDYIIVPGPNTYSAEVQLKRPRIPRHLDLFVQALSPAAHKVETELLHHLKNSERKDLTFSIHFISHDDAETIENQRVPASSRSRARMASIREVAGIDLKAVSEGLGPYEHTESLRQACIFQKAPLEDFFSYVSCRNRNLQDPTRGQLCFVPNEKVTSCIEKGEGEAILRHDAALLRDILTPQGYNLFLEDAVFLWENHYGPFKWSSVDWRWLIEHSDGEKK